MKYVILTLFVLAFGYAEAQSYYQFQKVTTSDRDPHDVFGSSTSIDGNWAIIGAERDEHDENDTNAIIDAGSAYIYKYDGSSWSQHTKLSPSARGGAAFFGRRVDISGKYAIVGAHGEHNDKGGTFVAGAGAAFIFEYDSMSDTWTEIEHLSQPVRKSSDYFGHSVAIHGDYAVVGAYFEDEDELEMTPLLSAGSASSVNFRSTGFKGTLATFPSLSNNVSLTVFSPIGSPSM